MANDLVKATKDELTEYLALRKAAEGQKSGPALARLRDYVQMYPNVFDGFSSLAEATFEEAVNACSPGETTRIHIRGDVDALRRSLGLATTTPLERLLIDDVAICWVRMQIFEQLYTANYDKGGVSFAKATYLEYRLSATRRRYLQAIESLARVRRLLSRVGVQVNIAQKQIITG